MYIILKTVYQHVLLKEVHIHEKIALELGKEKWKVLATDETVPNIYY